MKRKTYKRTQEHKDKMSQILLNHVVSVQTKENVSKMTKQAMNRPEIKERLRQAAINRWKKLENRKQHGVIMKVVQSRKDVKEKQRQSRIKYMRTHNGKFCDTDIERILYAAIDVSLGLKTIKQYHIQSVGLVDFYIPDYNLVVEADGDYWRNRRRQKNRDAYRNNRLKELGYRVIRFMGSMIKSDLQSCINAIGK